MGRGEYHYHNRVRILQFHAHSWKARADAVRCRTLFTSSAGLEHAKQLISAYKLGKIRDMTPELWSAKKIVDSTLHPGMQPPAKVAHL